MSPQGEQFTNETAQTLAQDYKDIIIVSGRYEGIDSRIKEVFPMDDISVGPFVLTGGELPAMIITDTISRQIPGILGNFDSVEEGRAASEEMYTRPSEFTYKRKKYSVPEVFLSGHHAKLEERRKKGDKRK
jgi:tRNA (guanine37-N1)-methyltransferase